MVKSNNKLFQLFFPPLTINYQNAKTYIPALDGLRGIAILLVILFHTFHFMFGWCGVDLFFILSGFLITGSLLETRDEPHYFRNFWIKRTLRIFPLYYLVLIIILLPKQLFNIETISYTSWSYWFYVQNWVYTFNGIFPHGKATLNHFWSLAIEEQFYFLFPFIVKYLPRKSLIGILLLFIIIAIGFRYYFFSLNNIGYYVATVSRLDALSIGAMLAYLVRYNISLLQKFTHLIFYSSLAYIVFAIVINQDLHFSNPHIATFGLTAFALFFGCILVYALATPKISFLSTVLNNSSLKFIGKIAYGLYVFHWILYVFMKPPLEELIFETIHLSVASKVITSSIVFIASFTLAYLSYYYFEKKVMGLKRVWVN
ncbi:acyltransferase family protein [Pedobacter alpinus]|uniref:Acyltransferase family protein n=1 Tax=Pedobacter alpinus TaxID=1590643 RepID=A0ABW5TTW1_9SPHI